MPPKYVPFWKYRVERCKQCLRLPICEMDEHSIILCSLAGYFKGEGDRNLLTLQEEEAIKNAGTTNPE